MRKDPNLFAGSGFGSRIPVIGSDTDPEPKGYECQLYVVKREFSCFKSTILSESTKIMNLKLVEKRN